MTFPGVHVLAASIVNALTFELLVDIPVTFIVNNSGPWATSVGVLGTLLFVTACVIYAFPDIVCKMTKARLLRALSTMLRYLLPWIGLRLLWTPGNRLLCLLTTKLFSRRCHRRQFLNSVQLMFGGLCLYAALHRTGLTRDFECRLLCYWRRTIIYRCFCGCRPNTVANITIDLSVLPPRTQPKAQRKPSKKRKQSRSRSRSGSKRSGSSSRSCPSPRRSKRTPKPKQFTCC